jgi:hypothetical protein
MHRNRKAAASALLLAGLLIFGTAAAGAQDFGFGPVQPETADASGVKLGGILSFSILAFPAGMADGDFSNSAALPEAALTVEASGAKADAFIGAKVDKNLLENSPADILDEAWLRIYAGQTSIQGGLMRVFWGRADSLSVLDVLNPHDLSDLTIRDEKERKIAVPMLRVTQSLGDSVSADFVYLPVFEGDRLALTGPWVPAQLKPFAAATFTVPDMKSLDYGQAGIRLAAGLSGLDLGAQYFYGYMTTPYMDTMDAAIFLATPAAPYPAIDIGYNRYHQVGADAAFVAGGFNIRLEGALNLTEDSAGDDPLVYNRNIAWSAGFDRGLFAGIDLNLQVTGKVRLDHDAITSPLDIESGSELTTTQIAALLSRSFAQDRVKLELLGMLGVEKQDYMVESGLTFVAGDAEIALRGRYFGGDASGDLGQFNDKSYVSLSAKYQF